jgi:hypothetical protein
MNGLLANLRAVCAIERAQHPMRAVAKTERSMEIWLRRLFGFIALIAAPLAAHRGTEPDAPERAWDLLAIGAVLLTSGQDLQPQLLAFTPREVLFSPDKRSLLALRLLRALPNLLLRGLLWALAVFVQLRRNTDDTVVLWAACGVAFLAPFAWNVGNVLRRLWAPKALASAFWLALLLVAEMRFVAAWPFDSECSLMLQIDTLLFGLGGAAVLVCSWARAPAAQVRALWPDVLELPRLMVLALLFFPVAELQTPALSTGMIATGVVVVAIALPFGIWHALIRVDSAEANTGNPSVFDFNVDFAAVDRVKRSQHRAAAAAIRPMAERMSGPHVASTWRAAWRLHWFLHGFRSSGGPFATLPFRIARFVVRHLVYFAMPWYVLLMRSTGPAMFVLSMFAVQPLIDDAWRERYYAWGVDHLQQLRIRMLALLVTAGLPMLVLALLLTVFGWRGADALMPIAVVAAFVLRLGWRGLQRDAEVGAPWDAWVIWVTLFFLERSGVPLLHWWTVLPALLLGLVGCRRRLDPRREREYALAAVARRERADARSRAKSAEHQSSSPPPAE